MVCEVHEGEACATRAIAASSTQRGKKRKEKERKKGGRAAAGDSNGSVFAAVPSRSVCMKMHPVHE